MEILELMKSRHSVRQYENRVIEQEKRNALNKLIDEINKEAGLNIQAFYDEPKAFDTLMASYGKFEGVNNYIALIGKDDKGEQIGYYGEKIVLKAQELGLNTCWVAMTYGKGKVQANKAKGEKIHCVLSLGYGKTNGLPHKVKSKDEVLKLVGDKPEWLDKAVEACLLAPTAMNQQKFMIICDNNNVRIEKKGMGFYTDVDLGIIKYHFNEITGIKLI